MAGKQANYSITYLLEKAPMPVERSTQINIAHTTKILKSVPVK